MLNGSFRCDLSGYALTVEWAAQAGAEQRRAGGRELKTGLRGVLSGGATTLHHSLRLVETRVEVISGDLSSRSPRG